MSNNDSQVIEDFGQEWSRFHYSSIDKEKLFVNFQQYFAIFPWEKINKASVGFDMGCGSGRWAQFVAPKVGTLNCVEPSQAIDVARKNLGQFDNVNFIRETTDTCRIPVGSQDFGYSLGVLHHIPDTQSALEDCARLLKSGAPFLLYLYYKFDNKPRWYRAVWRLSDLLRRLISTSPRVIKIALCEFLAVAVYLPLARIAWIVEKFGMKIANFPLADYRHKAFYQMRNDALDRFGTRLEQRFSRDEIRGMLERASFERITFSDRIPFWCCVAYKK